MNYSDQLYVNALDSLIASFQAAATAGQPLDGLVIAPWAEYEPSKHAAPAQLLIMERAPRAEPSAIDGGFFREDVDTIAQTVNTIYEKQITFDYLLDLGAATAKDRAAWAAKLDRFFIAAAIAGIPVYDQAAAAPKPEVGRLRFLPESDVAHNPLPLIQDSRLFRDSIRFTPYYQHFYIQTPNQPMLTGVVLNGKPVEIIA